MTIAKLDTEARDMLKFLNDNSYMTYSTLATAFEDKYYKMLPTAELILDYLISENLVKATKYEGRINMIQVMHLGRIYEERLSDNMMQQELEKQDNRKWEIRILFLSSVLAIVVSLITNFLIK